MQVGIRRRATEIRQLGTRADRGARATDADRAFGERRDRIGVAVDLAVLEDPHRASSDLAARDELRRAVDRVAESRRVQDGHADVVLIAIERLDEDARTNPFGPLGERLQPVEKERLVLGTRATGRDARKIPRASPDRDDHDAGAELAGKTEQLRDVGARGRDVLGIRIDEPAAVPARDRGHRDPLADRGPSFLERWALRELESVETKAPRRLKFLRERRSRYEPVLDPDAGHDGARAIVVFISAISTQARRLALTIQ